MYMLQIRKYLRYVISLIILNIYMQNTENENEYIFQVEKKMLSCG